MTVDESITHYTHAAYQWLLDHPLYLWGAITAALNMARYYKLLERLEKRPWGAAFLDFVKATGIDPHGVLRALSLMASAKAASLGAGVLMSTSEQSPPAPRNTGDQP